MANPQSVENIKIRDIGQQINKYTAEENIKCTAVESLPFSTEIIHDSGKIQTLNGFNHSTAIFPDGSNVQIGQVDNPAPDTSGVISKVDRNNKSRDTSYGDQLDWGQLELKQGPQNTRTFPHNSVPLKQLED